MSSGAATQNLSTSGSPYRVYLGLGSNLGDCLAALERAVHALDSEDGLSVDWGEGIAPLYESKPVGGPSDQPPYRNSAIHVLTTLDPHALLRVVLEIETRLGRIRHERWGPRVIDIDLLLFEDRVIHDDTLSLPHPRLHKRGFVLEPLAHIAGNLLHPVLKTSIYALAQRVREASEPDVIQQIAACSWVKSHLALSTLTATTA